MGIKAIPVDQRVIDIDSRRFASIEKALVELITNSDDSYARLEAAGVPVSGKVVIQYERHRRGALVTVGDEAEGMDFAQACAILSYGGAHSPLARGQGGGRGFFGRGLKQAIFGLGSGWIETIHAGRLSRIELFRGEQGEYLYDDGGQDRDASARDHARLAIGERAGLNLKAPFVAAFARAVSRMIAPCVVAEQERLSHIERATTSGRTAHMIEHLLQRMNRAAIHDFGIVPAAPTAGARVRAPDGARAPLRFSTPFYYRRPDHAFHVRLLVDASQFDADSALELVVSTSAGLNIEPARSRIPLAELVETAVVEWTVTGAAAGDRGEILARVGSYLAWCEIVIAEHASSHNHHPRPHVSHPRPARDHGEALFAGYDFRYLGKDADRAVYSAEERLILINTAAPTVQLYVDGRGSFRDSARLPLAELFMDVISDELARRRLARTGQAVDVDDFHAAKRDIIRRYGSDIHLSFMGG